MFNLVDKLRRNAAPVEPAEPEPPLFFKIKFGDDKEAFFNCNCTNEMLSRAIKRTCHIAQAETLDLVSLSGEPSYFFKRPGTEYAHRILNNRESYIVATVEDTPTSRHRYTPLLRNMDSYPDVVDRLAEEEYPENASVNRRSGKGGRYRTAHARLNGDTHSDSSTPEPPVVKPVPARPRAGSKGWQVGRKLLASKRLRALNQSSNSNSAS